MHDVWKSSLSNQSQTNQKFQLNKSRGDLGRLMCLIIRYYPDKCKRSRLDPFISPRSKATTDEYIKGSKCNDGGLERDCISYCRLKT